MNMIRTRQTFLALALAACSSLACADYLCETKEREPTAQQKELFTRGAAAMRAALLPPPAGWGMQTPSQRGPSGKFCPDFKNEPVTFGASVLYTLPPTLEQRRQQRAADVAMRRELDELNTLPPDLQIQVTALEAENAKLNKEGREAEREKNRDLAKAKFEQAKDASRNAYKIRNDYSTTTQAKQRAIYTKYEKALRQDRELVFSVSLVANDKVEVTDGGAERILFGPANVKTNQATEKIVRIVAILQRNENATAEQFAVLKGLIDRTKLQALVAGNIPSIEDSQAAIAKQNEVIAQLRTQAIEQQKMADAERHNEQAAARAAKSGLPPPPNGSATPATSTPAATLAVPAKPTPVAASANTGTSAPTPPAKPAEPASAADQVKDVKDTVNKLKGLFGR